MKRTLATMALFAFGLSALAQDDKLELRYGFKKGEKFTLKMNYGLSVKIDKVPEILQGVVSEDPVAVKFDGLLDMEVTEIAADGSAKLTGTWKTAKAKGHVMVNDIDFDYDAAKKTEEKPKKKAEGDDPDAQGFQDMQDQLAKMVREPLKLSVDAFGKASMVEGGGKVGQLEGAFRSLNGLMGPLPKQKVGKGDTWKDEIRLEMPGVPGNVELKIRAENTVDGVEKVGGGDVWVLKSKFAVGKLPGEKEDAPAPGLEVKLKTEGEGEGKTHFSIAEARTLKSQSNLKIRVSATIPNPGGGDEMDLKAQVKIDMSHELGR